MRFTVEHRFAASVEAVETAMTDPLFFAELRTMPGIEPPTLLARRADGDRIILDVRYVFSGDLPSVARSVLGRGELAWIQHSIVDLARHRTDFTIEPERHTSLLHCKGVYLLRTDADHTVRTISGDLQVNVPLLAGRAERAITGGLVERLDAEADVLKRWIADH
jgi:hypothetical protein